MWLCLCAQSPACLPIGLLTRLFAQHSVRGQDSLPVPADEQRAQLSTLTHFRVYVRAM